MHGELPAKIRPVARAILMFVHIGPTGGKPGESVGRGILIASSPILGGLPVAAASRLIAHIH
jgi:hypothetical protein